MKQLHQRERSEASKSDEYETPDFLFRTLTRRYQVYPVIDVCATFYNKKCKKYIPDDHYGGALNDGMSDSEWLEDSWCNPPHSKNEEFVRRAYQQWKRNNVTIMMILPTNTMSSKYWHECIEGSAEYYPIYGRINFLVDGKTSDHYSRNAYICVIWRKN